MANQKQESIISNESLNEFFAECEEIVERVSVHLTSMESGKHDLQTVAAVYRDMHTMKGSSQLFGFTDIGRVAHVMETSLDPVRKGYAKLSSVMVDDLLACLDLISKIMSTRRSADTETTFDEKVLQVTANLIETAVSAFNNNFFLFGKDAVRFFEAPQKIERLTVEKTQQASIPKETIRMENVDTNIQKENQAVAKSSDEPAQTDASGSIRVQVGLLDNLMTLVGEMVLVRNQVLQFSNKADDLDFLKLSQRLNLVTSELQGEVMKTRMQPIGNVLSKFQRLVRDIAKDLDKKIEIHTFGNETELDKTLIEAVKDPLTHIIRNSCDHGIELPDERKKNGKQEQGQIQVRSYHEGGQVIIEIADDGRGLNRSKIIAKAVERGLITQEKAQQLSDREIYNFIFAPGFSTAEKVTTVSGRGVGMDVVKTNIEKIGGAVELQSVLNQGTTIRLKIPLTLAIVPALIVRSGTERFAIPQIKLVELVRLENSDTQGGIEYVQSKPMYRLRGNLLPLVSLRDILKIDNIGNSSTEENSKGKKEQEITNIVVLDGDKQLFGLVVDEIQDTADIVVKPLSRFLKSLFGYSGATVMGDGTVSLILDVIGIAHLAQLFHEKDSSEKSAEFAKSKSDSLRSADATEFIFFKASAPGKFAIPLCLVHRLEEFPRKNIEFSGSQMVIRYRDSLLPLIHLSTFLKFDTAKNEAKPDMITAIVVQWRGKNFGIVVDSILDISLVEKQVDDSLRDRPGISGNLIYGDEVVVVVDAYHIIESEFKRMNRGSADDPVEEVAKKERGHILLAEDSAFFRKQIVRILERAGFQVSAYENGALAFKRLESSGDQEFIAIISDIEMPQMDGFQFASSVRKNKKWQKIPMIALSTKLKSKFQKTAVESGFNLYLEKLNEKEILNGLVEVTRVAS